MTWHLYFVPSTPPHVRGYDALLDALDQAGFEVRLLCVEAAHVPAYRTIDLIRDTGRPFETLAVPGYRAARHWFWRRRGRKRLMAALAGFLRAADADVLIFAEDTSELARCFIRAARQAGVKTVLVPDGLILPLNPACRTPLKLRAKRWLSERIRRVMGTSALRGTGEVDLLFVLNRSGFDELRRCGVPASRMQVVVSAEHETLAARAAAGAAPGDAEAVRERLGFVPGQPVVTYFEQPSRPSRAQLQDLIRVMYTAARGAKAALLVKMHPRSPQPLDDWRVWAAACFGPEHSCRFAATECTSVEAIRVSAISVTMYSTVAVEALMLGCPLVLVDYLNQPYKLPYGNNRRAAISADSPAELHRAIVSILEDDALRASLLSGRGEVLVEELGDLDGKSTARSVEHIRQLAESRRGTRVN